MDQLADLHQIFGEGWCVTLAALPADEALRRMGVEDPAPAPDGLGAFRGRSTSRRWAEPVLLLGRSVSANWSVVIEMEGSTGWVGAQPEVLERLARPGHPACTAYSNPNQTVVLFREHDGAVCGIDPLSGRRWGDYSTDLSDALIALGFPVGYATEDDPVPEPYRPAVAALLAIQAATGVIFTRDMLDGAWKGGLSRER